MDSYYTNAFKNQLVQAYKPSTDSTNEDNIAITYFDCARCQKSHTQLAGIKIFSCMLLQSYRIRGEHLRDLQAKFDLLKRGHTRIEDHLYCYENRHNSIVKQNEKLKTALSSLKKELIEEITNKDKISALLTSQTNKHNDLIIDYEKQYVEYKECKNKLDEIQVELRSQRLEVLTLKCQLLNEQRKLQKSQQDYRRILSFGKHFHSSYHKAVKSHKEEIKQIKSEILQLRKDIRELNISMLSDKINMITTFSRRNIRKQQQIQSLINELNNLKKELDKSITTKIKQMFANLWQRWINTQIKAFYFSYKVFFYMLPALPPITI